ncbi:hypothetical protein HID58_034772, partial [Brassica napus]
GFPSLIGSPRQLPPRKVTSCPCDTFDGLQQGISRLLMSSLWRLRDCLPPLPRPSFLRNQDLKPRQPISLLFSSEGLMVDRLRLFTSSNHSFQPETSGYSVHVAMFTRSCLAEDDTLITQLFVKRNVLLEACMHKVTEESEKRGAVWSEKWPEHIWKSAQEDFTADMIVEKLLFQSYFKGEGIDWWCSLVSVIVEVDRILRPQGTFIVNDGMEKIGEIEKMMESLKWNVRMTHSRYGEGVISVQKSWWRPTEVETITSAIESERELV